MSPLTMLGVLAIVFGAGLVTGLFLAAKYESDRENFRRQLHRRYGGHRS